MSFKKTFTSRFTKHLAAVMAVFSAPIVLSGTAHAQGNNWGDRLVETIVDSSARQLCKNFFDASFEAENSSVEAVAVATAAAEEGK